MPFITPLRYPGGKRKVYDLISLILSENKIARPIYVEPYAGGAGLALALLFTDKVKEIYINDVDPCINAFWSCVLLDTNSFCEKIRSTAVTIEEWQNQRHIHDHHSNYSTMEVGYSTFFLNRTNRSGILKGGVIGGKNQDGPERLDVRFNKNDLIARIQKISAYRDNIHLSMEDAAEFIDGFGTDRGEEAFFYLDPPYYKKGKDLYVNYYKDSDHRIIAEKIKQRSDVNWIISYDNVEEVRFLYSEHEHIVYSLNYTAAQRQLGAEIMFFSKNLKLPQLAKIESCSCIYDVELNCS